MAEKVEVELGASTLIHFALLVIAIAFMLLGLGGRIEGLTEVLKDIRDHITCEACRAAHVGHANHADGEGE